MTEVKNARIVLSGASSGIGRALAPMLAERGAKLALVARRESNLRELAAEIAAAGHIEPVVIPADLSRRGIATEAATAAHDALGGVDVLINNAGSSFVESVPNAGDGKAARDLFEVNFWSPIALTAALLPTLLTSDRGVVVNVTSTVQSVPLPFLGYYAASKSALAQATRSLRNELRDTRVRVMEVVPGSTETDLRDVDSVPWREGPIRTLPPVQPDAVASAILDGLMKGKQRVVHPSYAEVPLELPMVGRFVAAFASRRIDTSRALG